MVDEREKVPSEALEVTGWGSRKPRKAEEDLVVYLRNVKGSLESGIGEEERSALVKNVLEEISKQEASLSSHKRCSFVLESLIRLNETPYALWRFMSNCKEYYGWLVYNRFSSHVVETYFGGVFYVLSQTPSNQLQVQVENEALEFLQQAKQAALEPVRALLAIVCDLSETLAASEEWWNMIHDSCASHSFRGLLCVLSGNDPASLSRPNKKSGRLGSVLKRKEEVEKHYDIDVFRAALAKFLRVASEWQQKDLVAACCDSYASPAIQMILRFTAPMRSDKRLDGAWTKLVETLLTGGLIGMDQGKAQTQDEKIQSFKTLCCHPVSSHIMQIVFSDCDEAFFMDELFPGYIQGSMAELSKHKIANYVFQCAIQRLNSDEQMQTVLSELGEEIATNLLNNNRGVLWRIAEVCKKHTKAQNQFVRSLVKGLRNHRNKSGSKNPGLAYDLLQIKPHPQNTNEPDVDSETKVTSQTQLALLGVLIIEAILGFQVENSQVILESIACLSAEDTLIVAKDPVGGPRVMQILMAHGLSHRWVQQRVLSKLLPKLVLLSENRYGNKVVQNAFLSGSYNDKCRMAKLLSSSSKRLAGNSFGADVLKTCKIQVFQNQPSQWHQFQKQDHKKKRNRAEESLLQELDVTSKGKALSSRKQGKRRKKS